MYTKNSTLDFVTCFNELFEEVKQNTSPPPSQAPTPLDLLGREKKYGIYLELRATALEGIQKFSSTPQPTEADCMAVIYLALCKDLTIFNALVDAFASRLEHQKFYASHWVITYLPHVFLLQFSEQSETSTLQHNYSKTLVSLVKYLNEEYLLLGTYLLTSFLRKFSFLLDILMIAGQRVPESEMLILEQLSKDIQKRNFFDNSRVKWSIKYLDVQLKLQKQKQDISFLKPLLKSFCDISLATITIAGTLAAIGFTGGVGIVILIFTVPVIIYSIVDLIDQVKEVKHAMSGGGSLKFLEKKINDFSKNPVGQKIESDNDLYAAILGIKLLFQNLRILIQMCMDNKKANIKIDELIRKNLEDFGNIIDKMFKEVRDVKYKKVLMFIMLEWQDIHLLDFLWDVQSKFIQETRIMFEHFLKRENVLLLQEKFEEAADETNILINMINYINPASGIALVIPPLSDEKKVFNAAMVVNTIDFRCASCNKLIGKINKDLIPASLIVSSQNNQEQEKIIEVFKQFQMRISSVFDSIVLQKIAQYQLSPPLHLYSQIFSKKNDGVIGESPYGGLGTFYSQYHSYPTLSERYFRREATVNAVLKSLSYDAKKIIIQGSSGSGKSALVADIIHQLARESVFTSSQTEKIIWWIECSNVYFNMGDKNLEIEKVWDHYYSLLMRILKYKDTSKKESFNRSTDLKNIFKKIKDSDGVLIFDGFDDNPDTYAHWKNYHNSVIDDVDLLKDLAIIFVVPYRFEQNFNMDKTIFSVDFSEMDNPEDLLIGVIYSATIRQSSDISYELLREKPVHFIRSLNGYKSIFPFAQRIVRQLPNMFSIVLIATLIKLRLEESLIQNHLEIFKSFDSEFMGSTSAISNIKNIREIINKNVEIGKGDDNKDTLAVRLKIATQKIIGHIKAKVSKEIFSIIENLLHLTTAMKVQIIKEEIFASFFSTTLSDFESAIRVAAYYNLLIIEYDNTSLSTWLDNGKGVTFKKQISKQIRIHSWMQAILSDIALDEDKNAVEEAIINLYNKYCGVKARTVEKNYERAQMVKKLNFLESRLSTVRREIQWEFYVAKGMCCWDKGDYFASLDSFRKAKECFPPKTILSMCYIGIVERSCGHVANALAIQEVAVKEIEKQRSVIKDANVTDTFLLLTYKELIGLYGSLGDYDSMEIYHANILKLKEKFPTPPSDFYVAEARYLFFKYEKGRSDPEQEECSEYIKKVSYLLSENQRSFEDNDTDHLQILIVLGQLYLYKAELNLTLDTFNKNFEICKKAHDEKHHPFALWVQYNIKNLNWFNQGDLLVLSTDLENFYTTIFSTPYYLTDLPENIIFHWAAAKSYHRTQQHDRAISHYKHAIFFLRQLMHKEFSGRLTPQEFRMDAPLLATVFRCLDLEIQAIFQSGIMFTPIECLWARKLYFLEQHILEDLIRIPGNSLDYDFDVVISTINSLITTIGKFIKYTEEQYKQLTSNFWNSEQGVHLLPDNRVNSHFPLQDNQYMPISRVVSYFIHY